MFMCPDVFAKPPNAARQKGDGWALVPAGALPGPVGSDADVELAAGLCDGASSFKYVHEGHQYVPGINVKYCSSSIYYQFCM